MSLADRARARALAKLAAAAGATTPPAIEGVPVKTPTKNASAGLAARNRDRRAAEALPARAAAVAAALEPAGADTPPPAAPAPAVEDERARAYRLKLVELAEDRRLLKAIQSVAGKIDLKRKLLPKYAPWVEGILSAEAEGRVIEQDEVFMTVMLWRIDAGDYTGAFPLAAYALKHGLKLPDRYKRDVATTVAEEVANNALKALATGGPADLDALAQAAKLTADHDMPDEVRSKLLKAQGLALAPVAMGSAEVTEALTYLTRAFDLNPKAGVKKEIEGLRRELSKLQAQAQPDNGGDPA